MREKITRYEGGGQGHPVYQGRLLSCWAPPHLLWSTFLALLPRPADRADTERQPATSCYPKVISPDTVLCAFLHSRRFNERRTERPGITKHLTRSFEGPRMVGRYSWASQGLLVHCRGSMVFKICLAFRIWSFNFFFGWEIVSWRMLGWFGNSIRKNWLWWFGNEWILETARVKIGIIMVAMIVLFERYSLFTIVIHTFLLIGFLCS